MKSLCSDGTKAHYIVIDNQRIGRCKRCPLVIDYKAMEPYPKFREKSRRGKEAMKLSKKRGRPKGIPSLPGERRPRKYGN